MSEARFFLKKVVGGAEVELKGEVTAGRHQDSRIKLTEGNPSRNHALFTVVDGAVYLEDLKSTNGTFINGERIATKQRLAPNDKVKFDLEEYTFRVEVPVVADTDQTAMRPKAVVADGAKPTVPPAWTENGGDAPAATKRSSRPSNRWRKNASARGNAPCRPVRLIRYRYLRSRCTTAADCR